MKSLHQQLLAAALVAAFGASAIAQTPAPATPAAPRTEMQAHRGAMDPAKAQERRARMEERIAKRLAAFKQKLKITTAQEGAWTAWTTAMKPAERGARPDRAEWQRLSTPERIDRMRVLRTARAAEMDRRGEATKSFYAALDAEQKKVFDAEAIRFMRGGKHGHHGRHHGGHGPRS